MNPDCKLLGRLWLSLGISLWSAGAAGAQSQRQDDAAAQPESGARQILPYFPEARAKSKTTARPVYISTARRQHSGSQARQKPKPRPAPADSAQTTHPTPATVAKSATPTATGVAGQGFALAAAQKLGVTFWKLQPGKVFADPNQAGCRAGGRELGQPTMMTPPLRAAADTLFKTGDRLRVSIESVRPGYLYVFNREVYADQSFGPLKVVFPTRRMRDGNNYIAPGSPIEFPDLCDSPNYIEFLPPQYGRQPAAEQLILVVTDVPIADIGVPADRVRIPESWLQQWEARWAGPSEELNLENGENQAYTSAELNAGFEIRQAGRASSRELGQSAPQPQTVFAVKTAHADGVLVTLFLWYE